MKIKINNNEYLLEKWKVKSMKEFLILLETSDNMDLNQVFNLLIKPYVFLLKNNKRYKVSFYDFFKEDILYLLTQLRIYSVSDLYNITFKCIECDKINEVNIPFEKSVVYKENKLDKISIDEVIYHFGNNYHFNEIELLNYITKIEFKDKEINELKDIEEYILNLDIKTYNKLEEYFNNNKPDFEFVIYQNCMFCNHFEKFSLRDEELYNFFFSIMFELDLSNFYKLTSNMIIQSNYRLEDLLNLYVFELDIYYSLLEDYYKKDEK